MRNEHGTLSSHVLGRNNGEALNTAPRPRLSHVAPDEAASIGDIAMPLEPVAIAGADCCLPGSAWPLVEPSRGWLEFARPLQEAAANHDHLLAAFIHRHEPDTRASVCCDIATDIEAPILNVSSAVADFAADRFQSMQAHHVHRDERTTSKPARKVVGESVLADGHVNLAKLLAELEPAIRLALPNRVCLFVDHRRADIWPIMVDRHKLSALLFELVTNARDAMGGVGTVAIVARNVRPDEPRLNAGPQTDCIVLSVRHNRAGMPGEALVRIDEAFFDDTGVEDENVDLVTRARAFAEVAGGAFVTRDILKKITAADIILPRADIDRGRLERSLGQKAATDSHPRVLLVDDDYLREIVSQSLEDLG